MNISNVMGRSIAHAIATCDEKLAKQMERLSTGSRINSASDSPSGVAMASRLRSLQVDMEIGIKNAMDSISLINTVGDAVTNIAEIAQRMRELAVLASTGSITSRDRTYINQEFQNLTSEMRRIANHTQWNGKSVLNASQNLTFSLGGGLDNSLSLSLENLAFGTSTTVQTQSYGSDTANGPSASSGNSRSFTLTDINGDTNTGSYSFGSDSASTNILSTINSRSLSLQAANEVAHFLSDSLSENTGFETVAVFVEENGHNESGTLYHLFRFADPFGTSLAMGGVDHNLGYGHGTSTISTDSFFNVSTASNATTSISVLDGRLDVLSNYQAQLGATVNRLTHSVDVLSVGKINITSSLSVLSDSDYALEVSEATKLQIIKEAATAMLAQANSELQVVLQLLK